MARLLKDYPKISLAAEQLTKPIDFGSVFGRYRPVHVEIGSGRGTFLVNQAKAQPDVSFLGIEWARKYYRYAVDRVGRWGLDNVRIIRTEAAAFIAEYVGAESVSCFHIYFPDPWPKKRHHKRRFFNSANLQYMLRALRPSGIIQVATDHEDYFKQIKQLVELHSDRLQEIPFTAAYGAENGECVGTNYERKCLKQKRHVFTLAAKKAFSQNI